MLIFADSFDHYDSAATTLKYDQVSSPTIGSSSPSPRTGVGRLQVGGGGFVQVNNPNGSRAAGEAHFGIQCASLAMGLCSVFDAGTAQWQLQTNSSGQIELYRGSFLGTLVATSTNTLATSTWYHIRVVWTVGNAGSVTVYVNGSNTGWINFSGDVQATGNATWNQFQLLSRANVVYYDDFVLLDDDTSDATNDVTAIVGTPVVGCVLPQTDAAAAGTHADFTPSTSTDHGALVDETPPDEDTTYNHSETPTDRDTYQFPALGGTGTIVGVQVNLYARKDDAGPRSISAVSRVGGTDFAGAAHAIDASYRYYRQVWRENPNTAAPWTVGEVDGAEFGLEVTA